MSRKITQRAALTCGKVAGQRRVSTPRGAGFSLVEVLVAIALLTIGIVAFLAIFPNGFFSLQIAANTSAADRLAQAELERLTAGNGAQIQQIGAVMRLYSDAADAADFGTVQLDPNFDLARTLTQNSGLTAQTGNGFNLSNPAAGSGMLNPEPYNYVGGERVRIPAPTVEDPNNSNTLLDFGPILAPASGSAPYYPSLSTYNSLDPAKHYAFFVHGQPWSSKTGSSEQVTTSDPGTSPIPYDDPEVQLNQDSPEYLVDYNNAKIALHQPTSGQSGVIGYPQLFVFQVRTQDSSGTITPHTVIFEADWSAPSASPPTNHYTFWDTTRNKPIWVSLAGATDVNGNTLPSPCTFITGSDKLVRDFSLVTAFTNDPYQFQLPNQFGTDPAGNLVCLGRIAFNPLASKIVDTRGRPLQASVDYMVQDWHTIHEDLTVGAQSNTSAGFKGNSTLRLTLKDLLHSGEREVSGNLFNGIGGVPIGGVRQDVLVYDLDSFSQVGQGTGAGQYTVDYGNGAITLHDYPTGAHVRVYYRPSYEWGVAAIKPAAGYTVVQAPSGGATPDTPTMTGQVVQDGQYLYFPTVDRGAMVQISGTINYTDSGGNAQSAPLTLLQPVGTVLGARPGVPAIDLMRQVNSGFLSLNKSTFVSANITNVTGASLTVRVIWQQRGRWRSRNATTVDLPSGS